MTFHSLLYLVPGLLILVTGLALKNGQIPRNAVIGVKMAESYESEQSWLAINQYGGLQFLRGGLVIVLSAALGIFLPFGPEVIHPILLLVFLGGSLIPTWLSVRFARQYGRR